ncbi:MAG: hypothetical protein FWD63_00590 [Propionibacteriaceae bacterium]|nr:hypothetical protein [Propionibacteriaceae bacterium]
MTIPPFDPPVAAPRRKSWLAPAIWVACIAVVALVVAAFNGFAARTDQILTIDPGTPVPLGLGQVRIDDVTLQASAGGYTYIVIDAAVNNTSGQPLVSISFDYAVVLAYTGSDGTLQVARDPVLGIMDETGRVSPRTVLPPIPGFVPVQFTFMISEELAEPAQVTVALVPVVYTQDSVLNTLQGNAWVDDQSVGHHWLVHMTA